MLNDWSSKRQGVLLTAMMRGSVLGMKGSGSFLNLRGEVTRHLARSLAFARGIIGTVVMLRARSEIRQ
jgi:hypothetical protein